MGEMILNKAFGWASSLLITFGFIMQWGTIKGWIIFVLTIGLIFLRFLLTVIQLRKTLSGEDAVKKSGEYKILKFLRIIKEK